MKTHLAIAYAALVLSALSTSPLQAAIEFAQATESIKLYNGAGDRGGVFYVNVLGSSNVSTIDIYNETFNGSQPTYDFPTFCVEIGESIQFNTTYYVASVSDKTVKTGYKLGSFAAWIYTEYLEPYVSPGTGLTGLSYYGTSQSDLNAIQRGIWLSMGYSVNTVNNNLTGGYDTNLFNAMFDAYKNSSWVGTATANAGNSWNYGYETGQIAIMNLKDSVDGKKHYQDQLVYVPTLPPPPTGTAPVPEPVSFFVWSMLAMCVGSLGLRSRD